VEQDVAFCRGMGGGRRVLRTFWLGQVWEVGKLRCRFVEGRLGEYCERLDGEGVCGGWGKLWAVLLTGVVAGNGE
jgi:hypothetical protein